MDTGPGGGTRREATPVMGDGTRREGGGPPGNGTRREGAPVAYAGTRREGAAGAGRGTRLEDASGTAPGARPFSGKRNGGTVDEVFDATEIFGDDDVQQIVEASGSGWIPKLEDLDDPDRELLAGFQQTDGEAERLKTPDAIISALAAGVRAFENLSDPMPCSWSPGWKKFVLYITALNCQFLWDRHHRASETAIFADWVVFSIEHAGWGPDGNSSPLGKQHSYCMAVAAEAGGGIRMNPVTGRFEAPDGRAARNYDPAAGTQTPRVPGQAAPQSSGYLNLFADAGTNRADQDKYSRYLDAAAAQGAFKADEIVGVGEGPSSGIYVVDHRAVTRVSESGIFKKRLEATRVGSVEAIAKLDVLAIPPTDASNKFEGRSWTKLKITGRDSKGRAALEIEWGFGSDSQNKRECEHLLKLIGKAMES
jgi:hypothetical protein